MSYTKYIEEKIKEIAGGYNVVVVDEIDHNYNPEDNDILVVIKKLTGAIVGDVKFMPIQLEVFSANNEVNDTMEILDQFVARYSNTSFIDELDFYKQDYGTPTDMSNFLAVGSGFRSLLTINGSLMITTNISDIKEVLIDGLPINYLNVSFGYNAQANPSKLSGEHLQRVRFSDANLQISITCYCSANNFNNQLSLLKSNQLSPNKTFKLSLTYVDNERQEEYVCRISSFTSNYDITNPPTQTIVFTLA